MAGAGAADAAGGASAEPPSLVIWMALGAVETGGASKRAGQGAVKAPSGSVEAAVLAAAAELLLMLSAGSASAGGMPSLSQQPIDR